MGETTSISWCDHTFNPWIGCTKVSPACDGCYAEAMMDKRYGRVKWGAPGKGAGTRVRTSEGYWRQPLRWNSRAAAEGARPFVFCSSLADVFDNKVPAGWQRDLFGLIAATPQLVWLLLSKRPQNILPILSDLGIALPRNVALGATCEDQTRWDINVPALIAAKWELQPLFAFVSAEPLLGRINARSAPIPDVLRPYFGKQDERFDPLHPHQPGYARIDWIITGGETDQGGHQARPSNPQWFRDLRDDCAATETTFHHKQNGEWVSVSEVEGEGPHFQFRDGRTVRRIGKNKTGRSIDGVTYNARPEVHAA